MPSREVKKTKPSQTLKTNQKLAWGALIVAIGSFLISGLTLYFQYFHKSTNLKASVQKIWLNIPNGFPVTVEVLFSNMGNTECMVNELQFQTKYYSSDGGYFVGTFPNADTQLPFSVKPNELTYRKFVFSDDKKDIGRGAPPETKIECKISFTVADKDGRPHIVETPSFLASRSSNNAGIEMEGQFPIIITLLPSDPINHSKSTRTLNWREKVHPK